MMNELSSQYDILKVIGHGGFSAVFKARSKTHPEKVVALKQLDYTIENEDAKEYKDFKEEVDILKGLNHPNIVKIYGENILDRKPSLEMEFVDGETLETILKREKYLSVEDTLDIIEQIGSALSYCHQYHIPDEVAGTTGSALLQKRSIVHNDVNPKNIIRTKNNEGTYRYVLIDFGLSFTDPDAVRHSKKEDGMAEYKSPEKWNAANVDTPSDIYSFGIVIYELLTGAAPFPVKDYNSPQEMIELEEKHKSSKVPDICNKRKAAIQAKEMLMPETCDIPDWLQMLVLKCLEKEPSRRFQTGRDLVEFYYNGLDGKIDIPVSITENQVIDIDPENLRNLHKGPFLEVVPNILTEAQHFFLKKDHTTIGRSNDMPGVFTADFSLRTADKFISKNHCQLTKRMNENNEVTYYLGDTVPSKNGTFYNAEKNTTRLNAHVKIKLRDGDYFWIGNTKIIFHG